MSTGAKSTVQYRVEELSAVRKFPFGKKYIKKYDQSNAAFSANLIFIVLVFCESPPLAQTQWLQNFQCFYHGLDLYDVRHILLLCYNLLLTSWIKFVVSANVTEQARQIVKPKPATEIRGLSSINLQKIFRLGVEDKNKWTKKLFLTDCKGLETST